MAPVQTCVNHPREETRLACSSCDRPICGRCVRRAAVGQKCPDCARTPRAARTVGKPQHYVRAVGGGLAAAVVGGVLLVELLRFVAFGSLILSGLLGFGIGRIVHWGAAGQTLSPFPQIAAALGALAALPPLALVLLAGGQPSPWRLLGVAVAGYFAYRGAHG